MHGTYTKSDKILINTVTIVYVKQLLFILYRSTVQETRNYSQFGVISLTLTILT